MGKKEFQNCISYEPSALEFILEALGYENIDGLLVKDGKKVIGETGNYILVEKIKLIRQHKFYTHTGESYEIL